MTRNESRNLMRQYPVYIINRATRNLSHDATFTEIEAECDRLYKILGGRTFFQELKRRMGAPAEE